VTSGNAGILRWTAGILPASAVRIGPPASCRRVRSPNMRWTAASCRRGESRDNHTLPPQSGGAGRMLAFHAQQPAVYRDTREARGNHTFRRKRRCRQDAGVPFRRQDAGVPCAADAGVPFGSQALQMKK
jgi:hypothetical protein